MFSRYIFTVPIRNKKASVVVTALKSVLEKSSRKPEILRTDKGSEFKNKQMASFLNERGIHQIFTQNETKSNFAERAIQNLRAKMSRMFSQKNSFKYLKELQDITNGINNTPNRSLGNIEPSSVNKSNDDEVRLNAYLVRSNTKLKSVKNTRKKPHSTTRKMYKRPVYKFKINDRVRISRLKTPFLREASEKWTGEIFIISHRYLRDNIPVYKLKEFDHTPLLGTYIPKNCRK